MRALIFVFLLSCTSKKDYSTIRLTNESRYNIDSIQISINNYKYLKENLLPRETYNFMFLKDSVDSNHDVVYFFKGFIKDSVIFKGGIFSNDLGYIPDLLKMKITDDFKLVKH